MKKVLVFDLTGDYAHFRKYYTTTSPLTFLFPPRTAVLGIIGAILGREKDTWTEEFNPELCDIAIQIINPGRKGILKENWRKGTAKISKKGFSWADIQKISQIPLEVLRDAKFRIYFSHQKSDVFNKLKGLIGEKKSHYTPYLGLSEFICEVQGYSNIEYSLETAKNIMPSDISTVVPESALRSEGEPIVYEQGKEYFELTVPNHVNSYRQFNYLKVLFERKGESIKAYLRNEALRVSELGVNILFMR